MTRVAVTRAERDELRRRGIMLPVTASTRAVVFLDLPAGATGVAAETALASLRRPRRAPVTASMETHYSERQRIVLSDLYDADARRTSGTIASMAARSVIPHPLSGVAYADGHHRSALPWRKVPA